MTFGMAQVDHRRTWLAMRDTLTIKALSESLAERKQALQERVKEQTAELRRTVESLREREALLSNSQQLAKVGYFVYDPEREVFRTSPQLDDILGLRPDGSRTLEGWRELVHPAHRERVWAQMMTQLRDTQSESEMMYPVQRRTDGAMRWVRSRSQMQRDAQGRLCAWFGNMQDITEQKEAEEKVHQLAFYDPLTQLANRRRLQELLPRALQTCQQDQTHGALMVLDLDNFKVINDTRGHAVGDQLLVEVAQRISANVRGGDTASRLGGDEFVVLAQGLDPDPQAARAQSMAIAEQLRLALSQPYLLNGLQFYCSTSIGVTLLGGEEQDAQTLLSQADLALYRAKAAGRNAIMFFDAWMQAAVAHKAALEEGLRHAIERRELVLHYQPQVDHDGRIAGAEALLRWVTSAGRSVSPAEFIPLAEESELILHIGAWVLDTGCAQLCRWQSAPSTQHLRLAINVSARQLLDPDFPQLVAQTIERHQVRPAGLKLELTENLVMGDLDQVVRRMHQLRQLGLGFSLDDFGTGYSSLSYLRQLPLDQLKIDQSFVRDLKSGTQGATILQAIVNLGTSLELEIIAEGVETLAQRQFLADCGCTLFQGYLFARPLPIEQFPTGPLGLDGVSP
jgi:diguanylate cyclase (GGDEF)-like protein/PAS domain S-box-containing protein